MTSGSDKTHSYLDSLPFCLIVFLDGLKHRAAPVLSCLFLIFLPICSCLVFSRTRNSKDDRIRTRVALQALVKFVAPTCSLWPRRYIELASAGVHHTNITLPFEVIIRDTINGVIELRSPNNDLVDLIGSGVIANGHTIRVTIGWKWWIKYFKWWMFSKSKAELNHNMRADDSNYLDLLPSSIALTSSTLCPPLCLDCLPHGIIPTSNAGCRATLEFTTFSPSLRMLSTARIISVIPSMISELPRRRPRLLTTILQQLDASYGPNVIIESLSNVSVDYERALRDTYKSSFAEPKKIRETWVKIVGIKAWRREMFLLALEAALVRRGWIERWSIQVAIK